MLRHFVNTIVLSTLVTLVSACGSVTLTPTPIPPTETAILSPLEATVPRPTKTPRLLDTPTPTPSLISSGGDVIAQLVDLPIDEFLEQSFRQLQLRDPDLLYYNGFADFYDISPSDRFSDMSEDYIRQTQQFEHDILDLLHTYDRSAISEGQKISYDSLEWYLTMQVRGQAFSDNKFLVNPIMGLQNWPLDFLQEQPLDNRQDAENYITRLSSLDTWADQVIEGLERNEQAEAIPPIPVLENTIDQLDAILAIQGSNPPVADQIQVYTNFSSKISRIKDLSEDERKTLLNSAFKEVEETVIPAYLALKDHLIYLTTIAIDDPNQWKLPGGQDYYNYLLAYYTGTNMSADEIHDQGLAEVARIQADIQEAAVDMGLPADISMAELNQWITEHSQIITGEALRQKYEQILTAANQATEAYFDLRSTADVVIRTETDGPPAYYAPPKPGSQDPGVMPINPGISPLYVNYNEYVLVHHETIPGHHTQLALAQELDLPVYQRLFSINPYLLNYQYQAYVEGWALYGEILAWEMGLYDEDPLANLGRLRLRLLRTVRMVVDSGIHAKGWTLGEAAAYLEEVTGMNQSSAQLARYLVNPGYNCGYNVGGLKILEMRQRAMEKLGDKFDIQDFHNVVLGNGILPIGILENVVDDWIAKELEQASTADNLAQLEGLPIKEFFEQSYRLLQLRDPDRIFLNGLAAEYGISNDHFTNISDDFVRQTQQLEVAILDLLHSYDRNALSHSQQVSYDVYEWILDDRVRGHPFTYYDYPVNSLTIWGKQNWLVDFMVNHQPFNDRQDIEHYISRLSQIGTWTGQLLEGLKKREQAGVVPPRHIIQDSISQVEGHLHMRGSGMFDVEAIELYSSFREKLGQVEGINSEEKQHLLDKARSEIEQVFIPAFLELRDYLLYLESIANDIPGVYRFPEGQAYYAYLLRHQTGTDLSPEQVHELGLSEVARIQGEMRAIADDLCQSQDISMTELDECLSTHSDYLEGELLSIEYDRLIAAASQATESYFDLLPQAELVIQPEPFGSGIGYYLPPPLDGSGPGIFYTNLDFPIHSHIIPSYVFHETIPGHHLQGALARELELPTFRRELDLNGYIEGWAVYAERLAWEMGLYAHDPWGNLGRLQFELSRAARLVIDTGIHARGWSRQEAAAYYEHATGMAVNPSAMDRYIILPGQGCGYTIGLLKILELRQQAIDQLGDQFNIKEFHNVMLGNGSLPLEILESVAQSYINTQAR